MKKTRIPDYNFQEEMINSISHGFGAVCSVFCLILLLVRIRNFDAIYYISCIIYGISMILLYLISCLYHALRDNKKKYLFRVFDHCSVFLLEAGTFTPIILISIDGIYRIILFIIIWLVTLVFIILNIIDVDKYNKISVCCNLCLGWSILLFINPLLIRCGLNGVLYLIIGGLMYSIGALFYGIGGHIRYMHSIFHFFVLLGSLLHFILIYKFII